MCQHVSCVLTGLVDSPCCWLLLLLLYRFIIYLIWSCRKWPPGSFPNHLKKKSRIPKEFLRKIRSLRESSCPYTRLFNTVTVSVVYMGLLCWNYASKMYCRWLIFDTSSRVFVSSFMQLIQKKTITSFPMSELNNKKDENFPNPSIQLLILIWVWVTGAVAFFLPSNLL